MSGIKLLILDRKGLLWNGSVRHTSPAALAKLYVQRKNIGNQPPELELEAEATRAIRTSVYVGTEDFEAAFTYRLLHYRFKHMY